MARLSSCFFTYFKTNDKEDCARRNLGPPWASHSRRQAAICPDKHTDVGMWARDVGLVVCNASAP